MASDQPDDERAIGELVETWMAASKEGDVSTVLDLMSDDALFLVAGREPFGKEEFRTTFDTMRDVQMDGLAEIREIEVHGGWAWVRNHIDLTLRPVEGEPLRRSGYTDDPAEGR